MLISDFLQKVTKYTLDKQPVSALTKRRQSYEELKL